MLGGLFKASSANTTRDFYEGLAEGANRRGILGMEKRFDGATFGAKRSVMTHFVPVMERYLSKDDTCLDLGCGTGGFLSLMAPLCGRITGADIVPSFAEAARLLVAQEKIVNADVVLLEGGTLPFETASFDKVVMIDVIHHLEAPAATLAEVTRVLKPGGTLIIFEPNKWNPVLLFMMAVDRNEHGLWKVGAFSAYRRLLADKFDIDMEEYSGLLISPEGSFIVAIADWISEKGNFLFNWLSPKLFVTARKIA